MLDSLKSVVKCGMFEKLEQEYEILRLGRSLHILTKQLNCLHQLKDEVIMKTQDAIDALNALSTASDGLSVKVDNLVKDTTALITALGTTDLTPDQQAAVTKAQASATAAANEGDKVDAAVKAADAVLPTPAPAAPTP